MLTNIQDGIVHIETGNVTEQIKMELSEKWYSERLFCHDNQSYGLDFFSAEVQNKNYKCTA